ncbi:hypothetical protein AB0D04_31960 [Streptomyces sp. NPDC048483]|uniref:hypothetical protein n=1 Tax=Streptomyces sp. NPDC048483 TaxID=3154927 RepID=UPI0034159E01
MAAWAQLLGAGAVQGGVVAERERGTTWEQLARAAGTTRQSAHERWSPNVQTWARLGRAARTTGPTADMVAFLDEAYAQLDPDRAAAVSAGLDANRHPGSAASEDPVRATARGRDGGRADAAGPQALNGVPTRPAAPR